VPKILIVISGSVAAFKALELIRILKKNNCRIEVLLTKAALEFVTKLSVTSLGAEIIEDEIFDLKQEKEIGHINLSRRNDLIIIYPATANLIAKIANGIADDLASLIVSASNKPVFIAPAMNTKMYENIFNQENIKKLQAKNIKIIDPEYGKLACNEEGVGKLADFNHTADKILDFLENKERLKNKKILITAGATREKIDPVRFISNFSSGKQAMKLAKIASFYGAQVTMVKAYTDCQIEENIEIFDVETADEMYEQVKKQFESNKFDAAFFVAAVSDYKVKEVSRNKIKKDKKDITLELEENPDILKSCANSKNRAKIMVGFAAETDNLVANAKKKINSKNCDYLVLNDVSDGKVFASDNNSVSLINKNLDINQESGSKEEISKFILKQIFKSVFKV
jgi:phosphopantothenoylcysteine decarboxylase / phosphopantothenate---cysteine ligase